MAAGLDVGQRVRPARVDLDAADRVGLPRILRAILPARPRGANAADEIQLRIEMLRQGHRDLSGTDVGPAHPRSPGDRRSSRPAPGPRALPAPGAALPNSV